MTDKAEPQATAPVQGKLNCRLRKKTSGRSARSPIAGELELQNCSDDVVEIETPFNPLVFMNLIVKDESGTVVSEGHYGDRFSPAMEPRRFVLQPGETYVGPVHLLGNVPEEKLVSGTYVVQAVYRYQQIHVVSDPFEVHYDSRN